MIESSSYFFLSILDNGYAALITINSQINAKIESYSCQEKSILFFQ